ncbi:hypothetical protein AAE478_009902 [Parahypoxylon ruwenzoriense]
MTHADSLFAKLVSARKVLKKCRVGTSLENVKNGFQTREQEAKHGSIRKGRDGSSGATTNTTSRVSFVANSNIDVPASESSCHVYTASLCSRVPQGTEITSPSAMSVLNTADQPTKPSKYMPTKAKSRTFPISGKEERTLERIIHGEMQNLDEVVNGRARGKEIESGSRDAGRREAEILRQQLVPENFKRLDEAEKHRLQKKVRPGMMDSQWRAARSQREQAHPNPNDDSEQFVRAWELFILPKFEEVLDSIVKSEYSINARRGAQERHRIIDIMIAEEVSTKVQILLEECLDNCLDGDMRSRTTMRIGVGTIEYLTDGNGWHPPANTRRYSNPAMGDSVGPAGGGSATMGPLIQIAQKPYRILNWHVFDDKGTHRYWDETNPPALEAFHPSFDDSSGDNISIGKTVAYSGRMYKTSRISRSIRNALDAALGNDAEPKPELEPELNPVQTITDWVLVETTARKQVNRVRQVNGLPREDYKSFSEMITKTTDPRIGRPCLVYSTGRTSGYSVGQTTGVLARHRLQNGVKTRNWCIESTCTQLPDEVWNLGGMGMPGDSGAPVIDQTTHSLVGQIWGRNKYKVENPQKPPLTFFTAMSDIYDDIQEQMPGWDAPCLLIDVRSVAATNRSTSPAPSFPLDAPFAGCSGRRQTLDSISEDRDKDKQPKAHLNKGSAARATVKLSGHRNLPGCEPVQRWAMIAQVATF